MKDFNRRVFLAQLSKGLGLITASNLFNQVAFSQTAVAKKNVIFIFFNHSANIPLNDLRGTFHFGNGTSLGRATQMKDDAYFVRNVSNQFTVGNNAHEINQAAAFTGMESYNSNTANAYNGRSLDLVIGDHLKKTYNTTANHLNIGYSRRHGDNITDDHPYMWETSTFAGKGNVQKPIVEVSNSLSKIKNELNCRSQTITAPSSNAEAVKVARNEHAKLTIVRDNLNKYVSKYLMPKEEFEKLTAQINSKIELKNRELASLSNSTTTVVEPTANCNDFSVATNYNDNEWRGLNNFTNKSNAFFDLMVHSLKNNYTRSITYYTNIWDNNFHGEAHNHVSNPTILRYHSELFWTLNQLAVKLKSAGIYDDTMIVITGEFPHQNVGQGSSASHRSDKIPWLIVNSGKSGEFSDNTPVHPGDVHCAIAGRMGLNINSFGSSKHETKRAGNNNKKILV